jgi:hypothetical protein
MKAHLLRFGISLGCMAFSFVVIIGWVRAQIAPDEVTIVRSSIDVGEPIKAESIASVELPGRPTRRLRDLVPWARRGLVVGRISLRRLEPDQLLLFGDLSSRREPPPGRTLVFIRLEGVTFHSNRIRPGDPISFVVRTTGSRKEAKIGPFEVFDAPLVGDDASRMGRGDSGLAMSVLTDPKDANGQARELVRAIADRTILSLERAPLHDVRSGPR